MKGKLIKVRVRMDDLDMEMEAMKDISKYLEPLSADARRRVVRYVVSRFVIQAY